MKTSFVPNNSNIDSSVGLTVRSLVEAITKTVEQKGQPVTPELEERLRTSLLGAYSAAVQSRRRAESDSIAAAVDEMAVLNDAGMRLLANAESLGDPFKVRTIDGERPFALQRVVGNRIVDSVRHGQLQSEWQREAGWRQSIGTAAAEPNDDRKELSRWLGNMVDDLAGREFRLALSERRLVRRGRNYRDDVTLAIRRLIPDIIEELTGFRVSAGFAYYGKGQAGAVSEQTRKLMNDPGFRERTKAGVARCFSYARNWAGRDGAPWWRGGSEDSE